MTAHPIAAAGGEVASNEGIIIGIRRLGHPDDAVPQTMAGKDPLPSQTGSRASSRAGFWGAEMPKPGVVRDPA